MEKKGKVILASKETLEALSKQFNVTKGCVYRALNFSTNSGLAKSIRIAAVEKEPNCYYECITPTREDLCTL